MTHDYLSTACFHTVHRSCRRTCKFCAAVCRCGCHEEDGMKTVAVDFDGVLNTYTGWQGEEELFQPREGVQDFLARLYARYEIVIHTTRDSRRVQAWLEEHGLSEFITRIADEAKPKAVAYIDDRAVRFAGDYDDVLARVDRPTHWESGCQA